jgi:hypothetical protein
MPDLRLISTLNHPNPFNCRTPERLRWIDFDGYNATKNPRSE